MSDIPIFPRLKSRLVLITGASAGIGKTTARYFAASGSNLILVARRVESLTELKADLEAKYGVSVTIAKLDVSKAEDCDKFYEELPAELRDNVDILVNNAAAWAVPTTIVNSDWSAFGAIIDTNVKAVVKMIKLFVPGMLKRNVGHIINVGSIVGKEAPAESGLYSGSKFFLEAITASLRAEVVATDLRVSLISPGMVHTDYVPLYFKDVDAATKLIFGGFDPLQAEDIADGIVYIASRPPHVQIVDIAINPTAQASISALHRKKE